MSVDVACLGILISGIVALISFIIKDDVGVQSTRILSGLIFIFSFPLSPLLVKVVFLVGFFVVWPYVGDRITMSIHRQVKK